MPTPTPTPAERFATTLRCLSQAMAAMSGGDRLFYLLIAHIIDRIRGIKQGVARLVARLRDGRYAPRRRSAPPRPPTFRRPRRPSLLPHNAGWLLKLVPDAVGYRSQVEFLFRDPEMVALLAAAPASLRRPLRSLCWMLRLPPTSILAPAPAPAATPASSTPAAPSVAPKAAAARLPSARPPSPPRRRATSAPKPPPRACGPPLPA